MALLLRIFARVESVGIAERGITLGSTLALCTLDVGPGATEGEAPLFMDGGLESSPTPKPTLNGLDVMCSGGSSGRTATDGDLGGVE